MEGAAAEAYELLALVAGQDVEEGEDHRFRIVRKVARDRVISTVDPEARHGHKSRNRRFDGFKAHLSVDPDSEVIDEVVVTPANTHDADVVDDLLADHGEDEDKPTVFGDSAYAGADTLAHLNDAGYDVRAKVPPASNREGRFSKDDFGIDLEAGTVACPAGHIVAIRFGSDGAGRADFASHCGSCPLRERCTTAAAGRTISIHPEEAVLQRAKAQQADPEWQQAYRAHPAQGGAQDRPLRAGHVGRPQGPHPGPAPRRHRRRHPGRRSQLGPVRHPRRALGRRRLGDRTAIEARTPTRASFVPPDSAPARRKPD